MTYKRRGASLAALIALLAAAPASTATAVDTMPGMPVVRPSAGVTQLTLRAQMDPSTQQMEFRYAGGSIPPLIRVTPGDHLVLTYTNDLPVHTTVLCANGLPCSDMTNMHFHGLHVSPHYGQDDILTMIAMPPGQTLHYDVAVPTYQVPGLYWYHTHPHGDSWRQDYDGMSGPIIIDGIDRYVPQVRGLPERVMVIRERPIPKGAAGQQLTAQMQVGPDRCGPHEAEPPEDVFTINEALRPSIGMTPGRPQFWRILNAAADRYVDVAIPGQQLEVVAMDGVPLAYHDPAHPTQTKPHVLLAPGARVEAIVTGPPSDAHAQLKTRCFNSGKDGDPHPGMTLADIVPVDPQALASIPSVQISHVPPVYDRVDVTSVERSKPQFVATFTEGNHRFYINKKAFALNAPPMTTVHVGSYVHWRILNHTDEVHPFHIHQTHFLAYAEDGVPVKQPAWLDDVNVPSRGSVDVIIDATDPVIRGMSVFHCHLLNHEDKGMMAKVLFK